MKATILDHARAGAAVILSSHLLHLVEEICTRVLIMRRGKVLAFGTIGEIVAARPDLAGRPLEDVFLGLLGQDVVAES
jgi:ABC-2 type transport system ATP-binding protein